VLGDKSGQISQTTRREVGLFDAQVLQKLQDSVFHGNIGFTRHAIASVIGRYSNTISVFVTNGKEGQCSMHFHLEYAKRSLPYGYEP
jgi:hypothetical protein